MRRRDERAWAGRAAIAITLTASLVITAVAIGIAPTGASGPMGPDDSMPPSPTTMAPQEPTPTNEPGPPHTTEYVPPTEPPGEPFMPSTVPTTEAPTTVAPQCFARQGCSTTTSAVANPLATGGIDDTFFANAAKAAGCSDEDTAASRACDAALYKGSEMQNQFGLEFGSVDPTQKKVITTMCGYAALSDMNDPKTGKPLFPSLVGMQPVIINLAAKAFSGDVKALTTLNNLVNLLGTMDLGARK